MSRTISVDSELWDHLYLKLTAKWNPNWSEPVDEPFNPIDTVRKIELFLQNEYGIKIIRNANGNWDKIDLGNHPDTLLEILKYERKNENS